MQNAETVILFVPVIITFKIEHFLYKLVYMYFFFNNLKNVNDIYVHVNLYISRSCNYKIYTYEIR